MDIAQFREILFWPLEIPGLGIGRENPVAAFVEAFTHATPWCEHDSPPDYAERVYFHPFVQRFLYGPDSGTEKVFYRNDIDAVWLDLGGKGRVELAVENIALYLFVHGVAILALEVGGENLPLGQAQEILDRFRRAYPPYWESGDGDPGHCPLKVEWRAGGNRIACSDYQDREAFCDFAARHNAARPAAHWQYLLQPLRPDAGDRFGYRQLEDERMPFMAWLACADPGLLTRGDFIRLCFADGSGDSDSLPYARRFLEGFEQNHCYDRYWDYQENDSEPPKRANWMSTRYLLSGYGFVMVGKDEPGFFADEKNGALSHFRRHYFKMGLIAHYHRAALLGFSDALSRAVAEFDPESGTFRAQVKNILQGFLRFTHRYWFREVSSQVQARELFKLWAGHLDNEALFQQVKQEAQDANAFLDMRQQQRQTETTVRLTVVATLGLAAGLVGTYLAVPWNDLHQLEFTWPAFWDESWKVFIVVAGVVVGVVLAVWQSERLARVLECLADAGNAKPGLRRRLREAWRGRPAG